jgi:integrase
LAIDYSQYIYSNSDKQGKDLSKGIQANKNFTKFLYIFRVEGRLYRKTFDFTKSTNLNKHDLIKKVNSEAERYRRDKEIITEATFTIETNFEQLAKEYIKNKCATGTKWTQEKETILDHYIYPYLRKTKASAVKERDIDKIRVFMESKGHGRQNKDGCSPRTIRKVLLQVLKPILEYGLRNGAITRMPEIDAPAKPKKKNVKYGTEKLTLLYRAIHTLYKEDPFYRALFLFAFFGRRWNEIRTLEWTDIELDNCKYTIRAENSKIDEDKTFVLPKDVMEALHDLKESTGLVFKSPITGRHLSTPKKQMEKLRETSGIEELTLHYFRHIMATALGESGMVNTVLSASLGHNNSQTVDSYYRTANHLKGSEQATQAIEYIVEAKK